MNDHPAPNSDPMTEELALLGHDIRTAVIDILAGLALIDDAALSQANRQQLDRTRATTEGLVRLLEDGLTTLLTHAPGLAPQAPVELSDLIADILRRWAFLADDQVTVTVNVAPNLPAQIQCNRTAVERVLSNLITNAIHHSGGKPVAVDIAAPTPQELCFSVQDHGPGFPEAMTKPALPPAPTSSALPHWQTAEGHGLGLRIAQSLSYRMGGRVTLQNKANGGLAMFHLPIGRVPPSDPAPTARLQGQTVLVADDSATQLLLIGQFLIDCGAEVTMVRDGFAALSALRARRFDWALLDMEMPRPSGIELCADLAQMSPRPKIAVLTAHNAPALLASIRAAGADIVLTKPITTARALEAALCATPPAPAPTIAPEAFAHLLDIAGPEMAAELIARFQADLADVQTRLRVALPKRDLADLRAASHVLIALAGTAGASELEAEARQFNSAASDGGFDQITDLAAPLLQGLAILIDFMDATAQQRLALA